MPVLGSFSAPWISNLNKTHQSGGEGLSSFNYECNVPFKFLINIFRMDRRPVTCRAGLHHPIRNSPRIVNPGFVYLYIFTITLAATEYVLCWLVDPESSRVISCDFPALLIRDWVFQVRFLAEPVHVDIQRPGLNLEALNWTCI